MEITHYEGGRGQADEEVSVIYVDVEEPRPDQRCRPGSAAGLLRAAAVYVNRMADRVEDVRQSFERHSL